MNLKQAFSIALMLSLLISACPLQAGDNLLQGESSTSKRSGSPLPNELEAKRQVFARATYDSVAKHFLNDPEILKDFVRVVAEIHDVVEVKPLDVALNPLHEHAQLRKIIADNTQLMNEIGYYPHKFKVNEEGAGERQVATKFLRDLAQHYGELKKYFPESAKEAQVDAICRLQNGDMVMVEIQVVKQDYWDKRALAYAAQVYGNQLTKGRDWKDLKKVLAINILGGGDRIKVSPWGAKAHWVRHYHVVDKLDTTHVIPELQLVQYSLVDIPWDKLGDTKEKKDWFEFFAKAHEKQEVPEAITPSLKKAYEMIRFDKMSPEMLERYELEQKLNWENFTEYAEKVKELGLKEGLERGLEEGKELGREEGLKEGMEKLAQAKTEIAKNLLKSAIDIEIIIKTTGLSKEQIEGLKGED